MPQEKPNLQDRCCWEGKPFIQVSASWEDGGILLKSILISQCRQGFLSGGERESKRKKSVGVGDDLYGLVSTVLSDDYLKTALAEVRFSRLSQQVPRMFRCWTQLPSPKLVCGTLTQVYNLSMGCILVNNSSFIKKHF